jgi:SAM-dependent methyltransferase
MAFGVLERIIDRFSGNTAGARIEGRSTSLWERSSRFLYSYINNGLKDNPEVSFLNYGYAPLDEAPLVLADEDQDNRFFIQLYHRVAGGADLAGKDVVEISCGRGGGARYIKRYLHAGSVVGLDRCRQAVAFCSRRHAEPGLQYLCGDAQALPLASRRFDAVVNVEASHDYVDLAAFLSEVKRIMRPGGLFLYADFRKRPHCQAWREQIHQSGLELVGEEDITSNVATGLVLNSERNLRLVRKLAPVLLRPLFRQFAGTEGSYVHRSFATGRQRYIRFVLRKALSDR